MQRRRLFGGVVPGARGSAKARWIIHLAILAVAIFFGLPALFSPTEQIGAQEAPPEEEEKTIETRMGLLFPSGKYPVEEDDTCSRIAGLLADDESMWRDLLRTGENLSIISDWSLESGVPYRECPIHAEMELDVPEDWAKPAFRFVEVPTENGFTHWTRTLVFSVLGAILFGVLITALHQQILGTIVVGLSRRGVKDTET